MFTGIIEEIGVVQKIQKGVKSSVVQIEGKLIFSDLKEGDSVAVNGVCLTASHISKNIFVADVMAETLKRSTLGDLKSGDRVNLERALPINGRFGGHMVSGHIDGMGVITKIKKDDNAIGYAIKTTDAIARYLVEKGSVAIDGISLTVICVLGNVFEVSIIPHTAKTTILSEKSVGDTVNLENDVVGKYIGKLMALEGEKMVESGITEAFLSKNGY